MRKPRPTTPGPTCGIVSNRPSDQAEKPPAAMFIGARVNAWGVPLYQVRISTFSFDIGV